VAERPILEQLAAEWAEQVAQLTDNGARARLDRPPFPATPLALFAQLEDVLESWKQLRREPLEELAERYANGAWTLKDLLTMTSGIRWDESTVSYTDPANSCASMEASADWVQFVLSQPIAAEPGTVFVYNSGVTELLAQILKKATGKHADEYAREYLFGPLGIKSFYWKHTPTGHPDTEGGLYLAPRDLAKLGYLFEHDGLWNGKRILHAGWATESTTPHVPVAKDGPPIYGYQWWTLPEPGRPVHFAAWGYGGQYLMVVPSLDLIAVFTGWNIYDKPEMKPGLALQRILGAVKK